jgi:hypothetical protein
MENVKTHIVNVTLVGPEVTALFQSVKTTVIIEEFVKMEYAYVFRDFQEMHAKIVLAQMLVAIMVPVRMAERGM